MSSGGNTHWCYQCGQPVRPWSHDLVCPYCNGGFIQELPEVMGTQPGAPTNFEIMDPFHDPRFGIMDAFAALMRHRMAGTGRDPNFDVRTRPNMLPERRGPLLIFHGQSSGSVPDRDPLDFFFNNATGQRRGDFGDFFMGHGLHELIEQLSMNDRRGPPPAPRSAIDAMPTIKITQRHLNTDAHCPVCKDKFELGARARLMPCDHIYHSDCIVPWLVEHNSCPVCRVELPSAASGNAHAPARSNWNLRNVNSSGGSGGSSRGRDNSSSQEQGRWNPFSFLWNSNSDRNNQRHSENGSGSGEENNRMRWPFDY